MGGLQDLGANLTGTLTDEQNKSLPQLVGPNASNYQIPGMQQYTDTLTGIGNGLAANQTPNFTDQNAGQMGNQTALQAYMQNVAMGRAPSAADAMLQTAQTNANRAQQSNAVSNGGMNPALAQRYSAGAQAGIQGDIAGKSAMQKLQEQQSFGNMASNTSQAMMQQRSRDSQQQYADNMATLQARQDVANNIFAGNRAQTQYNVELDQNRQAFSTIQRLQQRQQMLDQQRAQAAIIHGIAAGVGTAAGAALGSFGGPPGMALGASLGGSLAGSLVPGGGAPSGTDPALLALLSRTGQGGQGTPNPTGSGVPYAPWAGGPAAAPGGSPDGMSLDQAVGNWSNGGGGR